MSKTGMKQRIEADIAKLQDVKSELRDYLAQGIEAEIKVDNLLATIGLRSLSAIDFCIATLEQYKAEQGTYRIMHISQL